MNVQLVTTMIGPRVNAPSSMPAWGPHDSVLCVGSGSTHKNVQTTLTFVDMSKQNSLSDANSVKVKNTLVRYGR